MPLVLWSASIKVDFHVEDVYSTTNNNKQDDKMVTATVDLKLLGGQKRLALDAAAFELKMAALECLAKLSEHMKAHFNQHDWP